MKSQTGKAPGSAVSTAEIIVPAKLVDDESLVFGSADREVLRRLAGEVAALAARPIEEEKRDLWRRHNALQRTRPVIFCFPENSWNEVFPPRSLTCEGAYAREWEMRLRQEIFWGTQLKDDYTIEPYFDIEYVRPDFFPDWGVKIKRIGGDDGGSYTWDPPIKTEADVEKLRLPQFRVDCRATQSLQEIAHEIFGDLLPVRVRSMWFWTVGMTWTLAELRGLEQIMFDMADSPNLVHRMMAILRDGTLALLESLEAQGLLGLNNDGSYVGSGALGWSDELPQPDFDGNVRICDMWGLAESQETVGVSPDMFAEFVLPYQLPIIERFGLSCYGCCEPLDKRWQYIKSIRNLRRVSVSPWANRAWMAERLEDKYIYSMKPNPAHLAMESFDEDLIRSVLREDLHKARECHVEIIMKDTHTVRDDPQRLIRWVEIARQEAERL